ncbi:hypothetical protein G5I_13524 [Acromyrmex echinatior]|uniref:Uncharacterized protein n=1 Tax=Acromyrmex echinatior TaxID=103372 RepID=F4X597_ACREC|nr:hypothetical protein G5I_13524 [Acromyrmex echinatior]
MSMNAEVLRNVLCYVSDTISNLQLRKFTASTPIIEDLSRTSPLLKFSIPSDDSRTRTGTSAEATAASSFLTYPKSYLRSGANIQVRREQYPVWQFARAYKRVKEAMFLVDNSLLVRMLKNKLSHLAYLAMEDENVTDYPVNTERNLRPRQFRERAFQSNYDKRLEKAENQYRNIRDNTSSTTTITQGPRPRACEDEETVPPVPLIDDEPQSDIGTEPSDTESGNENELDSSSNTDYILKEIDVPLTNRNDNLIIFVVRNQ